MSTRFCVVFVGACVLAASAQGETVSIPATAGAGNPVAVGTFASGVTVRVEVTGTVNLYNASSLFTHPDGSQASPFPTPYTFGNPGEPYPAVPGFPSGSGVNQFPGGGCNYDFTGSGWAFAGRQTTDTTDPAAIRCGAVVATWSASPGRGDWLYVGYGRTLVAPAAGGTLRLAVNESFSSDNTGAYLGNVLVVACVADLGVAGGAPGRDGLLDNNDFIAFINYFFQGSLIADLGGAGGLSGGDGALDNNDFIVFINRFFAGCG